MAVCLSGQRRPTRSLSRGRLGRLVFFWSRVWWVTSSDRSESGVHSPDRLRARAVRGGPRPLRASRSRRRAAPRSLVVEHPRQAGGRPARRRPHALADAARDHARHRQRQRPDDRGDDAAPQRATRSRSRMACGARSRKPRPSMSATTVPPERRSNPRAGGGRRPPSPRQPGAHHAGVGFHLLLSQPSAAPVARIGRHRSGSRRASHGGAAAAHGGASFRRHDRRLLRRRAVEPAIREPRHRPHRGVQPADLGLDAGEDPRHDRGLGAAEPQEDPDRAREGHHRGRRLARRAGQPARGGAHPVDGRASSTCLPT